MDATIDKSELVRCAAAAHSVSAKAGSPLLAGVLIRAESGSLRFSSTDLYLGICASSEVSVRTPGSAVVSAKSLHDIAKNMPPSEIRLTLDKSSSLKLTSGKVKFRVPSMPGEDFPVMPEARKPFANLPASPIRQLITLTRYAMSSDDTRPHLCSIRWVFDGKDIMLAATDGHRLVKASMPAACDAGPFEMTLPRAGVAVVQRLCEGPATPDVGVSVEGAYAFFRTSNVTCSVKLSDEQFPPIDKVIPTKHASAVTIPRDAVAAAVRRMSLISDRASNGIDIAISGDSMKVEAASPDNGEGAEEVQVDLSGSPVSIRVSPRYLLDALSAPPDDELNMLFGGALDPIVVKPATDDRFVAVVMPMR